VNKFFYTTCGLLLSQATLHASPTEKTQLYFESIKNNPPALHLFLKEMPKGGDLHMHLSGSSLPENMMRYAQQDNLCVNRNDWSVFSNASCPQADLLNQAILDKMSYNSLIDAWSMHNFNVVGNESGHDHFFNTFGKYSPISKTHTGEMLSEVTERAAEQKELYLELMITPDRKSASNLGKQLGWDPNFENMRQKLLAADFNQILKEISHNLDEAEALRNQLQGCETKQSRPGCQLTVRYLYQVAREQAPEMVFAQLLAGFESASRDTRIVGLNMVQPEDGPISTKDYSLHMQMVGFLHQKYPKVHISLHAGELNESLVAEEALKFHITEAVEVASAERIGHGVDILHENKAFELLKKMAKKSVMVEINLSSNDYILGIKGKNHPLALYLQQGVPVALSTDDEGVSLEPLTKQYERAVQDHQLSYLTLKTMVRNSLYFSFLPGKNLWADNHYEKMYPACKQSLSGKLNPECKDLLKLSKKAELQWILEKQFIAFEKNNKHLR
jgi:adenosine deaminase